MNITDIFSENIKCVNRVCSAVKNNVCGVEINAEIIRSHLFKAAKHGDGRFLTGFKQKVLTVLL